MPEKHALNPLWSGLVRVALHCRARGVGLAAVAALGATGATLAALEPLALKAFFDRLVEKRIAAAAVPFSLVVLILVVRELLGVVQDRAFWKARLGISYDLLEAMVERLHALPLEYHRETGVGATMTKIERGVSGVTAAFSDIVGQLFPALVYLCVAFPVMLGVDYRLSLVVLVFAPLPALVGMFAAREQTEREQGLMERWVRLFSRFNEVLGGILVVKSFVMEEREKRRFLGGVAEANAVVLRGVVTDSRTNAIRSGIVAVARLVSLGIGGWLVLRGEIGIGTLVAFLAYVMGVFQPVQTLTGLYQALRRATVAVDSVLSVVEASPSLVDAPGARDAGPLRGEVEFRDVAFGYEHEQQLLRHVDFRASPGTVTALVGPSGAGKSTIIALLQRLYAPTAGSILLDGHDVSGLTQSSVRSQIAVVLQEGVLFSDSIRDNIAFGRPGATEEQIEAAARAANAHDFITALPRGYETLVGERGSKLSGGERQRIAIARALLKDAPILVLDEATSALDAENEEKVQQALARLTRGRTTFVVAHRLSTIVAADQILVIRGGVVAERGVHTELVHRGGYYATVTAKQGITAEPPNNAPRPLPAAPAIRDAPADPFAA